MKNVVITGSSNGIGYLTVLTLARKGYKVWATMRDSNGKNQSKREELEAIAEKEGLAIKVAELDVTSDLSVRNLFEQIQGEDGKLDVLLNNAGVMYVGVTEAYSLDQTKDQFETNFFGVVRTSKAFLPLLKASKDGQIINTSSLSGRLVFPYFGMYCASKFALEAYSEALGYELKPLGVEVSIIEPGPFPSGLLHSGPKEDDQEVLASYGETAGTPSAMLQNFGQFFQSEQAPDTQLVADTALNLIETPKGERPIRVVSGIDYGTVELNEKMAPIQEGLIREALQLSHLL